MAQEDISIDPAVIAGALSRIYNGRYGKRGDKGIDRRLFEATHEVFNLATATGIAEAVNRGVPAPSAQFLELLDRNNAIFSAFRTHRLQRDVASLLLDDKGKIKRFADFKRDVTPVIGKYNGAWLRTEYATAVQRSRLATKWQQFADEADVFPNLEWVQSTALHPGEDHRIFWYTVRPVNDPFWSQHRPGDRWNCQCDLRQTDLPPTDIPTIPIGDRKNSPAPGLDNNPGTDGVIFNDRHPYFPKNCTTCPLANMGKKLMCLVGTDKKSCNICKLVTEDILGEVYKRKTFKSGGLVEEPTFGSQNPNEVEVNKKAAYEVAEKLGKQYRILPTDNGVSGNRNPDLLDLQKNNYIDIKAPVTQNIKSAVQNAIKEASKQGASQVLLYLTLKYSLRDLSKGLRAAFYDGRGSKIHFVIIRYENGAVKEYDVRRLRRLYKKRSKQV